MLCVKRQKIKVKTSPSVIFICEIANLSKSQFKKYIEYQINFKAYSELKKSKKSKVQQILNTIRLDKNYNLEMQPYLKSNVLTTQLKQLLYSLRTRNFDVKTNYRTMHEADMRCRLCLEENSEEDEVHVFEKCSVLHQSFSFSKNIIVF